MSSLLLVSWQATLVGAAALVAELLRLRPGLRHALWLAFALRLLLPPGIASPMGVAPAAPAPDLGWVLPLWLLGVAVGALLVLWRVRRAQAALFSGTTPFEPGRAAAAAARLGLRRTPRVLLGDAGPAVFGIARPTVVIPRRLAAALDGEALDHVLLHELAHVKRGDLLAQALFGAVNVLFWFHPLAWVARRRAYAARELLCDATVAAALGAAAPYRRTLLRAALLAGPAGAGAAALGGGAFVARIRALDRDPRRPARWRRLAAAALALVAVALAAPAPFNEGESLREELSRAIANPEAHGCLETRSLFLRAVALELEKP